MIRTTNRGYFKIIAGHEGSLVFEHLNYQQIQEVHYNRPNKYYFIGTFTQLLPTFREAWTMDDLTFHDKLHLDYIYFKENNFVTRFKDIIIIERKYINMPDTNIILLHFRAESKLERQMTGEEH